MFDLKIVSGSDEIFNQGKHLAFFGRSNVGKSSTINALLNNKAAAKTSKTPGKTVTFNFFDITPKESEADSGLRYLVDLPGYGYARHGEKFREKLRRRLIWYLNESEADIEFFCLVLDAKAGLTDIDRSALDLAEQAGLPVIVLVNKVDKLNQKDLSTLQKELKRELLPYPVVYRVMYYSAKTKKGVNEIKQLLQLG